MINDDHARLAINRQPSIDRAEYLDYMTFHANRRPLFTEIFGPLIGLKEEWAAQGATSTELDWSAFRFRCPDFGRVPVNTGWLGGPEPHVIEDTPDTLLFIDHMGRRMRRAKKAATLSLPETYPVQSPADWEKIKHHYAFSEARFAENWQRAAQDHRAAGGVVTVSIPGGFDEMRQLMGEELVALNCYDAPELIEDILTTIGDMALAVLDRVSAAVQVDQLSVHEDMAGRSGPLLGPKQVERFIVPYYRRIWDLLRKRGARLFDQDSDGDMRPVIPAFLGAGINVMHPIEPAADMDLVELRATYGTRLAFYGGVDKHVLRRGRAAIEAELEYKMPPMIRTGGCMLGLDHRIPNGTPLADYRFYIDKAWGPGSATPACQGLAEVEHLRVVVHRRPLGFQIDIGLSDAFTVVQARFQPTAARLAGHAFDADPQRFHIHKLRLRFLCCAHDRPLLLLASRKQQHTGDEHRDRPHRHAGLVAIADEVRVKWTVETFGRK